MTILLKGGKIYIMCDNSNNKITYTLLQERFRNLVDNSLESIVEISKGTGIERSLVNKHYNGDRQIQPHHIVKYAKYFNVSSDYLLGLSPVKTTDINKKKICEYTRLTDESVLALAEFLPDENISVLNFFMVESLYDFVEFLDSFVEYKSKLSNYAQCQKEHIEEEKTGEMLNADSFITLEKKLKDSLLLSEYKVQKITGKLLRYYADKDDRNRKIDEEFNKIFGGPQQLNQFFEDKLIDTASLL